MRKSSGGANASALLQKYKEEPTKLTPKQKDTLIMEYAPLIRFIAQKIAIRLPSHIELDDLISSGVIGLMDAIEKYDPTRDNKFKTYAEFRIRGAILDELRAQDWVPRSVRDKAKMLDKTVVELEAQLGRTATDEEVAAKLNISLEEFYDLVIEVAIVRPGPIQGGKPAMSLAAVPLRRSPVASSMPNALRKRQACCLAIAPMR